MHWLLLRLFHAIRSLPFMVCGVELKSVLMGTSNREPPGYSRNIMECKDPCRSTPIILLLYSSGVPCLGFPVRSLSALGLR